MKQISTLAIILCIGYTLRAQSSDALLYPSFKNSYRSFLFFDLFDQTNNFYYKNNNDTLRYINEKGKVIGEETTTNIILYDINKDSTFFLFPKDLNEKIIGFVYEKEYSEAKKSITFSITDNIRGNFLLNNENIAPRPISNNIYIITYSHVTKKYSFWICEKTGKNVKLITKFDNESDFKIDVYNRNALIIRRLGNNISKIEKFKID